MVGWHHQLHGHKFEKTPEGSEEQGSLARYGPRGRKEWDTTERLSTAQHVYQTQGLQSIEKEFRAQRVKLCHLVQGASLMAQLVKNPPAMQETPV